MHDVSVNAPTQIEHHNQALERRQTRNTFDAIRMIPWADEATFNAQILEQGLQSQNEVHERHQARIQRRALMTPEQQEERQIAKRLKRQRQRHRPPPTRMAVALGMDALTSGNHRRGAPASMDMSFASQLVQIAKSRDHIVVRCDEFNISKLCPRCSMLNRVTELHFFTVLAHAICTLQ
ncbi:hypothetical protein K492DRAFT_177487 [Lichtheimia hyalospora FSU 10163]|nr:hypothetical protein K492DRAFT_177487 [Lichtheimia hyalospora FSU 10163]